LPRELLDFNNLEDNNIQDILRRNSTLNLEELSNRKLDYETINPSQVLQVRHQPKTVFPVYRQVFHIGKLNYFI
jgi:hypothetical protein